MLRSEEEELVKSEKEWGDNFERVCWAVCIIILGLLGLLIYGLVRWLG